MALHRHLAHLISSKDRKRDETLEVEAHEIEPHILHIEINRPDARNAVNGAVAQAMESHLDKFEGDDNLWIAIISGRGKNFSAGADLKEIAAGNGASLSTPKGGFAGIANRQRTKPVIAAVHGPALAGGFEIALSADMIVATEGSSFGLPEVKRSLAAAAGGLFRLPRKIPINRATEMIATGDPISAKEAHTLGVVNRLAPSDEELLETALVLARQVATNAPLAVRKSLEVSRQATTLDDATLFRLSREAMNYLSTTNDYKEGPRAFIEKRPPIWQGN